MKKFKNSSYRANRISSLILFVIVALFGYETSILKASTMPTEPGPKLFPTLILVSTAILAAILFFMPDKKVQRDEADSTPGQALLFMGALFIGIMAIYGFGFFAGTFIGVYGMLLLADKKAWLKSLIFSVVIVGGVYLLFREVLLIPLPMFHIF